MASTLRLLRGARDPVLRRGLGAALREGGWVLLERRPVPRPLERQLRRLEGAEPGW